MNYFFFSVPLKLCARRIAQPFFFSEMVVIELSAQLKLVVTRLTMLFPPSCLCRLIKRLSCTECLIIDMLCSFTTTLKTERIFTFFWSTAVEG